MERNLDFDKLTDRNGTLSLKFDYAEKRGMPDGLLPLWVADMDFPTSSYIQDALIKQTEHGIFGYSEPLDGYFNALHGWMRRHYGFEFDDGWLIRTPGIVFALAMAVKAFTNEGDGVLIQLPVYYPFYEVIEDNKRVVISNTLIHGEDNLYHIDLEDFEKKIVENGIKLFMLCSPHNPVGRVWSREELTAMGDICLKHGVIVLSDEIHADFVFEGEHIVFQTLRPEYEAITITCTSPSKTFNLAGLQISNIFIPDERIRKAFKKQVDAAGYSQLGVMGLVACEAAYEHGEEWYRAMKEYVRSNVSYTEDFVKKRLKGVRMVRLQGTYLVWLDFSGTGLNDDEIERLIVDKAKLWLDSGRIFGESGRGYQRINVAVPRQTLTEALTRIEKALS